MNRLLIACLVLCGAGAAHAAATTSESCANGLAKDPRAIYDATAPSVTASSDLRALLTEKTRGLVKAGTIPRVGAREEARAAMKCLELKKKGL
jgi:hypothetical protein